MIFRCLDRLGALALTEYLYFLRGKTTMDGNVKFVIETAAIESDDDK